ncbi:pyridoxal-phosphate dependent enzyme, partial [Paraburkholderia caffeinitolerans]
MQVESSQAVVEADTTQAATVKSKVSNAQQTDYLRLVLTARVYDVARETELERAPNLSARLRNTVLLKREDNQPVFSFKLRGAYNKMAHLTPAQLE